MKKGDYTRQILERWICKAASYNNKNKHYYVLDGMHIRLNTETVAKWAKSIGTGMATVESGLPIAYAMALYKTAREAKKKKESSEKSPRKGSIALSVTINNPALSPNFGWEAS
jgi:hypothetical protein